MEKKSHFILSITITIFFIPFSFGRAQHPSLDEVPVIIKAKKNIDSEKANQLESLKLFAKGLLFEREDCLLEALQTFEQAAKLDPTSIAIHKKVVGLYVVLDRGKDALKTCETILAINSKDIQIWHLYSKQLQSQGEKKKGMEALKKGLELLNPESQGELGQQMYYELGVLQEDSQQYLDAATSYTECGKILKHILKDVNLEVLQKKELQIRLIEIYERSGKLFLNGKKYEESIEAFRQAQKVDSFGASRWQLHLAEVYQAQGNLMEALKAIDSYLLFQPSGPEAYVQKIKILKNLGKTHEILPWLKQASEKDQYNIGLKMLLADHYFEKSMAIKAEDIYLELLKHNPKAEIYQKLFLVYKSSPFLGMIKAVEMINQKIEQTENKELIISNHAKIEVNAILTTLRQDSKLSKELLQTAFPLLDKLNNFNPQTVQLLAFLADQNGQVKEAEAFYRKCLKKISPQNESLVYGGLLKALWKGKKYQEMVDVCKTGLKTAEATSHLLFHRELARAYARLNQLDKAFKEAKQAIQLAPESSRLALHRLYVGLLIQAKEFENAEKECKTLLKTYKQPGDIIEIRFLLSHIYSVTENISKAENELQLILQSDPNNATACNDLGYLWGDRSKNLVEAEKLIRKALELDREQRQTLTNPFVDPATDNPAYVDSLGWVLFRLGKFQEARKHLERAAKLGAGDDPVIFDHLGDVYFKLKMTQEAQLSWNKALCLYEETQARPVENRYKDLKEKINLLKEKN